MHYWTAIIILSLSATSVSASRHQDVTVEQSQSADEQGQPTLTRQQWMNRARKKHLRLFNIQRHIMERVGFQHAPDVSSVRHRLSDDSAERLLSSFNSRSSSTVTRPSGLDVPLHANNYMSKSIRVILPTCRSDEVQDGEEEQEQEETSLDFDLNSISFDHTDNSETRLLSATLWLKLNPSLISIYESTRSRRRRFDHVVRRRHIRRTGDSRAAYRRRRRPSASGRRVDGQMFISLRVTIHTTTRLSGATLKTAVVTVMPEESPTANRWVSFDVNDSLADALHQQPSQSNSNSLRFSVDVVDVHSRQIISPSDVLELNNCINEGSQPGVVEAASDDVESVTVPLTHLELVTVEIPSTTDNRR